MCQGNTKPPTTKQIWAAKVKAFARQTKEKCVQVVHNHTVVVAIAVCVGICVIGASFITWMYFKDVRHQRELEFEIRMLELKDREDQRNKEIMVESLRAENEKVRLEAEEIRKQKEVEIQRLKEKFELEKIGLEAKKAIENQAFEKDRLALVRDTEKQRQEAEHKKMELNYQKEILDKLATPIIITDQGSSSGVFSSESRRTQKVVVPLTQMGENRIRNLIASEYDNHEKDEL